MLGRSRKLSCAVVALAAASFAASASAQAGVADALKLVPEEAWGYVLIRNPKEVSDQVAKVVIDENSGIIVMGSRVRVSEVAIAQGNRTVAITDGVMVSQRM